MPCDPSELEEIPIFSLLDAEERAVLAQHVELRRFAPRQRIYRVDDPGAKAYIVRRGKVQVSIIDEDNQELVIDTPGPGDMFGLSSMLADSPHQTTAQALEETTTIEVEREDLNALIQRTRSARNPNEVIEEQLTIGDRIADGVARFGGSWNFIITFGVLMAIYVAINVIFPGHTWDPYPFILLNLFLSMIAAVQAPVIMMSQNRQDSKDRLRSELDFSVNRKAEVEITQLAAKLNRIEERVDDVHEILTRR